MVACGSLEMGADTPEDARRIAELLPAGTPVYVNHLPRYPLEHALKALIALREANLEPVPHVAARRVASRAEAQAFLAKAVRLAGITKVLLIGGDVPEPAGPYADGAQLLREDFFAGSGLTQVGLPGYPEGHPRIATAKLNAALDEKLALARRHGLEPYVVTQFSFAPNRVAEYCAGLARRAPGRAGLRRPRRPHQSGGAAEIRPALRRQRLAARPAGRGHARGAPVHPRGPDGPADGAGPAPALRQRQQRRGRAPLQLRRGGPHRRLDERAASPRAREAGLGKNRGLYRHRHARRAERRARRDNACTRIQAPPRPAGMRRHVPQRRRRGGTAQRDIDAVDGTTHAPA